MDNLAKIHLLQRWQRDPDTKKFKCIKDENHDNLIPFINGDSVLLKCPNCGLVYKNVSDTIFKQGHLILLKLKAKRRRNGRCS